MDIHEQFIIKYDTLLLKNKRGCSKWIEKCVENLEKMWKNSIIQKYLPKLLQKFEELTDTRNQSYITYSMKTICVTRLFGLLCGLTTMADISKDNFNTDIGRTSLLSIIKCHFSQNSTYYCCY